MRLYELIYLISPELSDQELKTFTQKITGFIQEEGGFLETIKNPDKRKLEYLIKKKGTAYSVFLNFYLNPEKLERLEKKLKEENQILRYLILTKKPSPVLATKTLASKPAKILKRKIWPAKPKVELKEIEKKLEEILGK